MNWNLAFLISMNYPIQIEFKINIRYLDWILAILVLIWFQHFQFRKI